MHAGIAYLCSVLWHISLELVYPLGSSGGEEENQDLQEEEGLDLSTIFTVHYCILDDGYETSVIKMYMCSTQLLNLPCCTTGWQLISYPFSYYSNEVQIYIYRVT